jgi:SAM-dependent methyltransferase
MSVEESMMDRADFVISTDVFEHVPPPVDRAFENLFKIVKDGGVCIFSVPYKNEGETREHFPDLHEYELVKRNGKRTLVNKTRHGDEQIFDDLRFHGGPGSTLELRLFSRQSLLANIEKAGFEDVRLHDESIPEFGVLVEPNAPSLIISMRKPKSP